MVPISNNEIKRLKSLQQKKFRDEYGIFAVEGEKMVEAKPQLLAITVSGSVLDEIRTRLR